MTYTYECRQSDEKDARNVTTSYGYDVLNRLTGVSYSDGTSAVSYRYGAGRAANCVGHLVSTANAAANLLPDLR